MENKDVKDFLNSATQFCSMIENIDSCNDSKKLTSLLISLLDLYAKALGLPEIEQENDTLSTFDIHVPKVTFGQFDYYWEVFDPYELKEPMGASLTDDVLDIYKEVKKGLLLYEQNVEVEAVWQWKFSFETHWGSHTVDAIRALHSAIYF